MKVKINIGFLISAVVVVYIIVIVVSFVVQKINQEQLLTPEFATPQVSMVQQTTTQQAVIPQTTALQILELPQTISPVSPASVAPMVLAVQPEQTVELSPSMPAANSIPSTKAIKESVANQNQRYQMVQDVMAQRKAQEARVRAAVENAPPRNKQ